MAYGILRAAGGAQNSAAPVGDVVHHLRPQRHRGEVAVGHQPGEAVPEPGRLPNAVVSDQFDHQAADHVVQAGTQPPQVTMPTLVAPGRKYSRRRGPPGSKLGSSCGGRPSSLSCDTVSWKTTRSSSST